LQDDLINIDLEQKAEVKIKNSNKSAMGKVTLIKPVALPQGVTGIPKSKVEITLENAVNPSFVVGFEADSTVVVDEKPDALAVKNEAIKRAPSGDEYIFLIKEGLINKVKISTGLSNDYYTEITQGISSNDLYIINQDNLLEDNQAVKAKVVT
jgi:hypothetical protein